MLLTLQKQMMIETYLAAGLDGIYQLKCVHKTDVQAERVWHKDKPLKKIKNIVCVCMCVCVCQSVVLFPLFKKNAGCQLCFIFFFFQTT